MGGSQLMSDGLKRGLEDVLVAESELSSIDGAEGRLIYRGHAIEDLAREASYEEVLALLWHGSLPDEDEFEEFSTTMAAERDVAEDVLETARTLGAVDADPMAALRTAVSELSAFDPDADADPTDEASNRRKGRRITAKVPTIIAAFERSRRDEAFVAPRENLTHAANALYMLTGEEPDEVLAETFDRTLILHADHGLNASTFAAMVTASTLSDLHAAITSAIGTLSGSLHGGANQDVMEMLIEVDQSATDPRTWIETALRDGRRIPGFGHRVYDVKDPRAKILDEKSAMLGEAGGDDRWYEMSVVIEDYLRDERDLVPNVDFYSASTYYQMDIPIDLYTPIFAMSRVGGWIAHVLEQYDDNRLIRPQSRYAGPDPAETEYVPLEFR